MATFCYRHYIIFLLVYLLINKERTEKTNMFSGIVRCTDRGEKLYYCTSKNFEAWQEHFVCSTSRLKGKEVCLTHYIRFFLSPLCGTF